MPSNPMDQESKGGKRKKIINIFSQNEIWTLVPWNQKPVCHKLVVMLSHHSRIRNIPFQNSRLVWYWIPTAPKRGSIDVQIIFHNFPPFFGRTVNWNFFLILHWVNNRSYTKVYFYYHMSVFLMVFWI